MSISGHENCDALMELHQYHNLPIDVLPVPHLYHMDDKVLIMNGIDYSVSTLSDTVPIVAP
jgi:hypothetical protein